MPFSVYSAGGVVDLLLGPQSVSQYSPTAIASLSPAPIKQKQNTVPLFLLWVPLLKHTTAKAVEDVLLRHKSQSCTALTCVIL